MGGLEGDAPESRGGMGVRLSTQRYALERGGLGVELDAPAARVLHAEVLVDELPDDVAPARRVGHAVFLG